MARKKKKEKTESGPFNPYFGKAHDESRMAKKPFWTWVLAVPGVILGLLISMRMPAGTLEPILGPVFGGVMGIAVGSLIDKAIEKRRDGKSE